MDSDLWLTGQCGYCDACDYRGHARVCLLLREAAWYNTPVGYCSVLRRIYHKRALVHGFVHLWEVWNSHGPGMYFSFMFLLYLFSSLTLSLSLSLLSLYLISSPLSPRSRWGCLWVTLRVLACTQYLFSKLPRPCVTVSAPYIIVIVVNSLAEYSVAAVITF